MISKEILDNTAPLPEFDQHYRVDLEKGRIYSLVTKRWLGEKAQGIRKNEYKMTTLKRNDGYNIRMYVHEVVYSAGSQQTKSEWREKSFTTDKDGKLIPFPLTVNHKNRNKHDNAYSNLILCPHKQQFTPDVIEDIVSKRKRLTKDEVIMIRQEFLEWEGTKTDFCLMMKDIVGVSFNTIESIINYKSHKNVKLEGDE
ncbi:HNH endonuclease [Evansella cellulosilytica]|uniref:Uncharacterized protein n=1 Tax=Evansella cellulosilytica (strain ATCC 21833 / DSM 2522 / FERM P-1141 / JCM 9156 / N-4) TaxID=649639 RepID=E6U1H9_EVAC2|nr:HNH endonuclease [Evansella cellulosilytica]ADU30342.1 hypothetical protein Bcell_2081 [Evansella cellulosilytica DSM 2522]